MGSRSGIGDQDIVRVRIDNNIALGIYNGVVTHCGD